MKLMKPFYALIYLIAVTKELKPKVLTILVMMTGGLIFTFATSDIIKGIGFFIGASAFVYGGSRFCTGPHLEKMNNRERWNSFLT